MARFIQSAVSLLLFVMCAAGISSITSLEKYRTFSSFHISQNGDILASDYLGLVVVKPQGTNVSVDFSAAISQEKIISTAISSSGYFAAISIGADQGSQGSAI